MEKKKSALFCFLAACLLCGLTACGSGTPPAESSHQPEQSTPEQTADTTVLVAYFSATGNTRGVAERIAALTGGDLYEITPAEPYTAEDLDYTNSESRTSLEMADPDARPALGGADLSLEGYDTLYLGYPIWHGQAPRILSTFAEQYDFDGLTIIPFCTSGSSGIGSSAGDLAMQAGSGTWLEGQRFSADVSEEELQTWIEGQGQ